MKFMIQFHYVFLHQKLRFLAGFELILLNAVPFNMLPQSSFNGKSILKENSKHNFGYYIDNKIHFFFLFFVGTSYTSIIIYKKVYIWFNCSFIINFHVMLQKVKRCTYKL